MEQRDEVNILDWTALGAVGGHRSPSRSVLHSGAALRRRGTFDAVLSDGEHVGIPLALGMSALRTRAAHVVIGHRLLTPAKIRALNLALSFGRVDRVLVHSPNQVGPLVESCPGLAGRLRVAPYGVDTEFWSPAGEEIEERLVVTAGREHRDYRTLLSAIPTDAKLFVADDSFFSPGAERRLPHSWPPHVERRSVPPHQLREKYGRASVVVVPVVQTTFPAGITTLLEAMSMGKAVIVSATDGLCGVVEDGRSGLVVPPGDPIALGRSVRRLFADRALSGRLGAEARRVAVQRFGLDRYVDSLLNQLQEAHESQLLRTVG
jgi:glycosyltransferase involved in cell wall biosynthesis